MCTLDKCLLMDQTPASRVVAVITVVVCCGLLCIDDVITLPLQPCSSLVNHVDSLIAASQPLPADALPLYYACIGAEHQLDDDDDAVRQLLALQPHTAAVDNVPIAARRGWSEAESMSGEACVTVECLSRHAALTFEPCLRLTQLQCSSLVNVLENIISVNSHVDNDAEAARLLQLFAYYQKLRRNRVPTYGTRQKRLADTTREKEKNKSNSDTGTMSMSGGNDKVDGRISSPVTSGAGGPRMRRSVPGGIPFQVPERMTPETRAIVASYLEWRAKNGHGRVTGRWG